MRLLKLTLIATVAAGAAIVLPDFIKGFHEGFTEQWRESFPNGLRAEFKTQ